MTEVDKKFRVVCVKDLVRTAQSGKPYDDSINYYYAATLSEAKSLAKKFAKAEWYQSEVGGGRDITRNIGGTPVTFPNPNVAIIECWNDEEQDWLSWFED